MGHNHPSAGHTHSGPAHNAIANLFFGGRRRHIYSRLAALSGASPGHRALDVGCADGYLTRLLVPLVGPTGVAHGVDPSRHAIAAARQHSKAANCTYTEGTAVALDEPDATYDVVVSILTLHHIDEPDRPRALGEMLRVLRPEGRLLIAEFRPPTNPLIRRVIRPVASPAMLDNRLDVFDSLLADAGFVDVTSGDLRPWIHYLHARRPSDKA